MIADKKADVQAYKISHPELHQSAVLAQRPGEDPWIFRPFGEDQPNRVLVIDSNRLFVAGERNIALFDMVGRRLLASMPYQDGRHSFLASRDGNVLLSCGPRTLRILRTSDLSVQHQFRVQWVVREAAAHADGSFVVLGFDESRSGEERAHIVTVDRNGSLRTCLDQVAEQVIVGSSAGSSYRLSCEARYQSLSPCGRWVLRPHLASVSMRGAARRETLNASNLHVDPHGRTQGLPFYTDDQIDDSRIELAIELWQVDPFEFVRRLIIDDFTIAEMSGESKLGRAVPSGTQTLRNRTFFLLSLAAELLPYREWTPDVTPVAKLLPRIPDLGLLGKLAEHQKSIKWRADGEAFQIFRRFRQYYMMDLEGRRLAESDSFLEIDPPPATEAMKAAALAFLEDELEVAIPLSGLDASSCGDAIRIYADRLVADYWNLVENNRLRARFGAPGNYMSEKDFFDHVATNCPECVIQLRRMWSVLDAAPRSWGVCDVHYDDMTGALGPAAYAFARLDPKAHELLEHWFKSRETEHEPFGMGQLLPEIIRQCHWGTREAIAFGLRILPWEARNSYDEAKEMAAELLSCACKIISSDEFMEEIHKAANVIKADEVVDVDEGEEDAAALAAAYASIADVFCPLSPPDDPWTAQVYGFLKPYDPNVYL